MFGLKNILFLATAALAGVASAAPAYDDSSAIAARGADVTPLAILNNVVVQVKAIKADIDAHVLIPGIAQIDLTADAIVKVTAVINVAITQLQALILVDPKPFLYISVEAYIQAVVQVIAIVFATIKVCLDANILGIIIQLHALITINVFICIKAFLDVVILLGAHIWVNVDIKALIIAAVSVVVKIDDLDIDLNVTILAILKACITLNTNVLVEICALLKIIIIN